MYTHGNSARGVCAVTTSLVNKSIRYYFAFSQKPRKLIGNNVAEIIVIRHSVWGALDNYVIEMHHAIGVVFSLLVV